MRFKSILFGTAAALGTATLLPIQQAAAQAQTAASAILEEVVVTARRREESLEDAPLSVVAISGAAMRAQGIYDTRQIGDFAANVNLQVEDRANTNQLHIRGIGGGFANPIQVFGTGMYIDGHYLAGSLGNFMSTMDVERVEVMRGPQGTLFGKNVTGGAVNIVSVKPQPEFESEVLLRAGDNGQQDMRAMLNVPFSDNVFGRFAVSQQQHDGFWTNRTTGGEVDSRDNTAIRAAVRFTPGDNWTIDATFLNYEEDGGQVGMRCESYPNQDIVDNLANTANGNHILTPEQEAQRLAIQTYPDGYGSWGSTIDYPDGTTANVGGRVELLGTGASLIYTQNCLDDVAAGDFVTSSEGLISNKLEAQTLFLNAVWDSGGQVGPFDNLQVRTQITARDTDYTNTLDRDKSSLPIDSLGHATSGAPGFHQENTGLEMIFDATVNDRLNFLFGLYYFDDDANTGTSDCWDAWSGTVFPQVQLDLAGDGPDDQVLDGTETSTISVPCGASTGGSGLQFQFIPPRLPDGSFLRVANQGIGAGPPSAFQQVNTFTESQAVFGHMNYALNDDWTLELGARWTEDDRGFNIVEFDAGQSCNYEGTLPVGSPTQVPQACTSSPALSYQTVMQNGFFNDDRASFSEVTPMASLTRQLAGGDTMDNGMVYFLYSEGFLTGSFNDEVNLFLAPLLGPLVAYGPEFVTNYEVGFKGSFGGGRVRLNADIFFMDYSDKQEAVNIDNSSGEFGPDPNLEFTQNAADVEIFGIEVELRASPWDGGFLTFDLGWFENEFKSFSFPDPENPGQIKDLSNNKADDRQPDWSVNASIGHTFVLGSGATLTPVLGLYAQGEYEWQPDISKDAAPTPCFQDSYTRFRGRVTYVPEAGNWDVSVFGDNIADERYLTFCEQGNGFGGKITAYGRPDWWGAEFTYRWGG